jgi:hypothetical protein
MRSIVVETMGEGVDERLETIEPAGQVVGGIELIAPWSLGPLDMSVELGPLGRQDEEGEVTGCTGLFEFGPELRSSVHLDARDREGRLGRELVEQGCGAERCGAAGDEADGPLGDGIKAVKCLTARPGAVVTKRVSTWTSSPGLVALMPLGRRLAWRVWPMIRKRRPPGLRRKVGIGVTTPRSMRLLRMRPTIETEAAMPSRVRRTKIFSLPHIGLSDRIRSTARISAGVQVFWRTRCGRRLFGSRRFVQR